MTYNFEEEIPTSIGPSEAVVFDDGTLYIAPGKWHTVFIGKVNDRSNHSRYSCM